MILEVLTFDELRFLLIRGIRSAARDWGRHLRGILRPHLAYAPLRSSASQGFYVCISLPPTFYPSVCTQVHWPLTGFETEGSFRNENVKEVLHLLEEEGKRMPEVRVS
mmetsp:Transcript_68478/g.182677  ORF Transcript_68478/g.182677 Transcript_68478/m.182677 type:complete len:108 (+) Transcript_68478:600-923(+)